MLQVSSFVLMSHSDCESEITVKWQELWTTPRCTHTLNGQNYILVTCLSTFTWFTLYYLIFFRFGLFDTAKMPVNVSVIYVWLALWAMCCRYIVWECKSNTFVMKSNTFEHSNDLNKYSICNLINKINYIREVFDICFTCIILCSVC